MKTMMTVGITGRSGSGKSQVARHYAHLGHPVADGDALAREATRPGSPCTAKLAAAFGADILAPDGALLRAKLAERAFATPAATARLNAITHPYILTIFLARQAAARAAGAPLFFIDGAAIVGGIFEQHCDKIILVTAGHRLSVSRIILRDDISKMAAQARLAAQMPEEELRRAADYVLENEASPEALQEKADRVLERLLREVAQA